MYISLFLAIFLTISVSTSSSATESNVVSDSDSSNDEAEFDEQTLISERYFAEKKLRNIIKSKGFRDQEQKKNTVGGHGEYFKTAFECLLSPTREKMNKLESLKIYINAQLDISYCNRIDLIDEKEEYLECLDGLLDMIHSHSHDMGLSA